jgi:hypothetical protein
MIDVPGSQESTGKILKHRWLAQKMLGRTLRPNEVVVKRDKSKEYSRENIIVFQSRYCANRWYSPERNIHLISRDDGTYDYDWIKIKKDKEPKKEYNMTTNDEVKRIKDFMQMHPGSTCREVCDATGIIDWKVRNVCKKYGISLKTIERGNFEIILLPRQGLLTKLKSSTLETLAQESNTTVNYTVQLLKRRGIKFNGNSFVETPFRHIRESDFVKVCKKYTSKVQTYHALHICEENFDIEARRHGCSKFKFNFTTSEDECQWINKRKEIETPNVPETVSTSEVFSTEETDSEVKIPETHEVPKLNVPYVEDIHEAPVVEAPAKPAWWEQELPMTKPMDKPKESHEEINTDAIYLMEHYELSLKDIVFLTGRTPDDLIQNGKISVDVFDIKNLKKIKSILDKANILELLKYHNSGDIAKFYNFNISFVEHVINSI